MFPPPLTAAVSVTGKVLLLTYVLNFFSFFNCLHVIFGGIMLVASSSANATTIRYLGSGCYMCIYIYITFDCFKVPQLLTVQYLIFSSKFL